MISRGWAAQNTAARLLAGSWTAPSIAAGLSVVLGPGHSRSRAALATRLAALGETSYPPSPRFLVSYLIGSAFFRPPPDRLVSAVLDPPCFTPAAAFTGLKIPAIATLGELAAWLGSTTEQLDWLADERRYHGHATRTPLQHYRYVFATKRSGAPRLIEAPKPRLKAIQRRILHEILDQVPVHGGVKGFVAGRSCLAGAQVHAAETMVATFDLAQFFPSIGAPRVHGLFRSLGYPWAVARRLAGLCTTVTPVAVARRLPDRHTQTLHEVPHLPQGAPTSPALANLLAWRLDLRLHGLARAAQANYTRYADDLAFSGGEGFASGLNHLETSIGAIAREEGFALNPAKTRIMPCHGRQNVTGIVVNAHCNVNRADFDTLKAILHNCVQQGPASQNRAAAPDFRRHLDGRIGWVEQINPPRGAKLRQLFEAIDWRSMT